ncbi:trypsin-like peptidase domain-containing protein [Paenibacillus filicis]|uniref:Trypsin-like peptidase domain-containing protein n=1 Tax=Paenibacillus gyeongsangnamensis TaxID=3388067 RepID=A0ABT4QHZ8_9BACL|nr:trypsin-like peptidase domain-containing protein [Paenibacillus filicis]MCZ8516518.1 trypsin-like peptidase domain-containing protein [Paenibacillus filicis]
MDNKNNFNDFFRRPADDTDKDLNGRDERDGQSRSESASGRVSEEPRSHYFSYGPHKSAWSADSNDRKAETDSTASDSYGESPVEMTPPKPLRSFSFQSGDDQSGSGWKVNKPKRTGAGFRSMFAAFMAGVLVVGGLMYASDKYNLFTGRGVMANGTTTAPSVSQSSSNNGGVKPTSLDISRPQNIPQIFQQASPAVVKVETKVKVNSTGRTGNPLFNDPFFRQFFGDNGSQQPKSNGGSGQLQPGGMGTGFIFEKSGYILTNEHVIDGADEIWVTVQGYDKPFKATLLGNSYDLDLAALKIDATDGKDFATLPLGKADDTNIGDWVVAIGNPYGFDHTVTVGVLSAKERPISIPDDKGTREYKHLLQTDASINPGNSGGPLLNMNGEVIGINTAVSAQAQGIGFAIPTSTISAVLDNLKNNVKIPKEPSPYIGVALQNIDQSWTSELKLDNTDGAIIAQVDRKSPAFKAGLRQYDVVTDVNGTKIKTSDEVSAAIKKLKVGDKASLGIMRDGKKSTVDVTVGDRNADTQN